TAEVPSQRLLERPLAVGRRPNRVGRRDRNRKDRRRQSEVDGHGAFTGEARSHAGRIAEVDPSIARRADYRCGRGGVDARAFALEPAGGPASELLVAPVLPRGANEFEARAKVTASLQGSQGRKQVPAHQVAGAADYDEPADHLSPPEPPSRA